MLSQTAEHALRALLFLAQRDRAVPVPADVVARAIGAPRNYLSKTLHQLARRGIVSGTRGPSGGFRLEARPEELTLARVVEVFEDPPGPPMVCLLGERPCSDAAPCQAHACWRRVLRESAAPLERTTLAELLGRGGESREARAEAEEVGRR